MEPTLVLVLLIGALMLGCPVGFALLGSGLMGIWLTTESSSLAISYLGTAPLGTVNSYVLTALPMFMLMAYLVSVTGIADDLFEAVSAWTSRIPGGLAIATVITAGGFGALSGSTAAAATAMTSVSMPNMRRHGYSDVLATGTIAVGSMLAVLIPPSIMMIVYGVATETSIGALFLAGVVPGLLLGLLLIVTTSLWVRVQPRSAPETYRVPWAHRRSATWKAWPSILIVFFLFGMLYSGFATATELAALGVLFVMGLSLLLGRLSISRIADAAMSSIRSSVMVLVILIGATVFGNFLALTQLPQKLIGVVADADLNRWVVILAIVGVYFFVSMMMDELPLLLITLPFTFPLITDLGFDPVWFGVMSMMMVIMGAVFPPVGIIAFIVASAADVPSARVFKGTTVLLLPVVALTVLLCFFPELALALPDAVQD